MRHLYIIIPFFIQTAAAQTAPPKDSLPAPRKQQLSEVVIKAAPKPLYQQQVYGTTLNVENSILTKGSSALQVLERSPGVRIDHQHNAILLNEKNGVMVMLNGKLMRMPMAQLFTLLDGMNANDIEKIELLTSPPANYDAEGSGGIINIVLKQPKKRGTHSGVTLSTGYGWAEKAGGSASITHHTDLFNLFAAYAYNHDHRYSDLKGNGSEIAPVLGGATVFDFFNETKAVSNNHNFNLNMDVKLHAWKLGSSIDYSNGSGNSQTNTRSTYNVLPDSVFRFNGDLKGNSHYSSLSTSLYATHKDLTITTEYLRNASYAPTIVKSQLLDKNGHAADSSNSQFAPTQRGKADNLLQTGVFQLDYKKQLYKKVKIEAGAKGTYTNNQTSSGIESLVNGVWVNRGDIVDQVRMWEGIGAAYLSLHIQFDTANSLVVGVRDEYYHTHASDLGSGMLIANREFNKLYPSLFFSHQLGEQSSLQFAYTKRITRPSYYDLSPVTTYNDPLSVNAGNPLLQPTITNNLKLGYSYKGYAASLLFSHDEHPIAEYQISASPSQDLIYISPQNITYQNYIGMETNLPVALNNWWKMNYHLSGGWRQFRLDYTLTPVVKSYFSYTFNATESFQLPQRLFIELSGWYNSLAYNGTSEDRHMMSLDLGIKKELSKGSLQLSVSDLFRTAYYSGEIGTVAQDVFHSKVAVRYEPESIRFPIVRLSYSMTFGQESKN